MLVITVRKKETLYLLVFLLFFTVSFIAMRGISKEEDSFPVVALDEYVIHEGCYYQRTLTVVANIDIKLIETQTYYQDQPLYSETKAKLPKRLLLPIENNLYAVFTKLDD
jgi:hypothetical protein